MKTSTHRNSREEDAPPAGQDGRRLFRGLCQALLLCGIGGALVSGCASGKSSSAAAEATTVSAGTATYTASVLSEGDVVGISFESATNLNTVAKIPLNGMLDLPFVGQVQAAGKTTQQLQGELLQLYSQQVRADVITVKLVQSASVIYVVGAVLQPGKIPMDRPMTVLEAVMEAGGYDPSRAKISDVTVVRLENGRQLMYRIDLGKALAGKDPTPFYLKPFDTVQVPKRTFNW